MYYVDCDHDHDHDHDCDDIRYAAVLCNYSLLPTSHFLNPFNFRYSHCHCDGDEILNPSGPSPPLVFVFGWSASGCVR